MTYLVASTTIRSLDAVPRNSCSTKAGVRTIAGVRCCKRPPTRTDLKLLVEGHPNRMIAGELGIDLATVKKHVGALMRKVGVKNRIALSVQVVNRKLLPGNF